MDKMLAIILIFVTMMILTAAILAMGAIPKIFQTEQIAQDTKNETSNQTEILIKYIDRQNNTTRKIIENQQASLMNQLWLLEGVKTALHQNDIIQKHIDNLSIENNEMLKKFGNENNAFARAIMKELGLDPEHVLKKYYAERNMTNQILE